MLKKLKQLFRKIYPNPELWLPNTQEQGLIMTLNGKEYIRCYYQCQPSFGQGDNVRFGWGWLSRADCSSNTRRMGPNVIEGKCDCYKECWKRSKQSQNINL